MQILLRCCGYAWAAPVTLGASLFVPIAILTGGGVQIVRGVIEVYGGWVTVFLQRGLFVSAVAMTLGHVVLGRDRLALDQSRAHESIHVRQYERWGVFFIPAYLVVSAILYWRGRDPYRDNPFEREAFRSND